MMGSALEKCSLLAHAIHGWWCCINQTWDAKWPGVSLQREAVRVAREIIGIEGEKKRRWWNWDDIKLPSIYELGESRITMKDQVYFPVFFFRSYLSFSLCIDATSPMMHWDDPRNHWMLSICGVIQLRPPFMGCFQVYHGVSALCKYHFSTDLMHWNTTTLISSDFKIS